MWIKFIKDYPEKKLVVGNVVWTEDPASVAEDIAQGYCIQVLDHTGKEMGSEEITSGTTVADITNEVPAS